MKKYCIKCGHKVKKETNKELKKEYPYYCPYCDENLYSIETYTKAKKYKWNKKKCFKNILKLLWHIIMLLAISFMFAITILGFCGIDYVL